MSLISKVCSPVSCASPRSFVTSSVRTALSPCACICSTSTPSTMANWGSAAFSCRLVSSSVVQPASALCTPSEWRNSRNPRSEPALSCTGSSPSTTSTEAWCSRTER